MEDFDSEDSHTSSKRRRQFIAVDPPSKNITLGTVPASAMEYLQQVLVERNCCPAIVISDIDPQKFRLNQSILFEAGNGKAETANDFISPPEYRKYWLREFSETRNKLFREKDALRQRYLANRKYLPKMKNKLGWCAFCLGEESMQNFKKNCSDEDIGLSKTPIKYRLHPGGYDPYMHFVILLTAPEIEKLLSYHIQWLKFLEFSHELGMWIFSSLACLETPLTPNAMALLRTLARICSKLRCKVQNKEDNALLPLNLIICLIAEYFGQKDLADPEFSEE